MRLTAAMDSLRPRSLMLLALLVAAALAAGCGGDDEPDDQGSTTTLPTTIETSTSTTAERGDLVVGIGEQGAAMFRAPRFKALGIKHARLVVAYDTARVKFEREIVDNWLEEAERAGAEPFITFQHSRVKPRRLPSVDEFREDFRAFRKRYPQVRVYAPWNEVNHNTQPTAKSPARAAEYFNVVQDECDGCTVLAGDLLDQAGMTTYLTAYRRKLDGEPRIWGLHNYADANRFRKRGLKALLKAVQGDVWLTETGGLVEFGRSFPRSEKRAARAVDFALDLAADTPRVARVYLYNWTGAAPGTRFDAGLVGPDGKPRAAYDVLKKALDG
jgi:hypothetical protein